MLVSRGQLVNILKENVCEVKFNRRVPVQGQPPTRRMLCTNNFALLNSENGRLTLNYRPTARLPNYDPTIKDLIITWDIFMQNYRQINCTNGVELVRTIPAIPGNVRTAPKEDNTPNIKTIFARRATFETRPALL